MNVNKTAPVPHARGWVRWISPMILTLAVHPFHWPTGSICCPCPAD